MSISDPVDGPIRRMDYMRTWRRVRDCLNRSPHDRTKHDIVRRTARDLSIAIVYEDQQSDVAPPSDLEMAVTLFLEQHSNTCVSSHARLLQALPKRFVVYRVMQWTNSSSCSEVTNRRFLTKEAAEKYREHHHRSHADTWNSNLQLLEMRNLLRSVEEFTLYKCEYERFRTLWRSCMPHEPKPNLSWFESRH